MFQTGTANYSKHRPDPPLHLIVQGGAGWVTWCGGGSAERANTATQRRCPRCLALARADLTASSPESDEASDLDWYVGRGPSTT